MTTAETLEMALIPVAGMAAWWLAGLLPAHASIGAVLLGASVLLLLQGLLRDLWLISKQRRHPPATASRQALCMCVESTVGASGVVAGLVVFGSAIDATIALQPLAIGLLVAGILAAGFAIKDFVIELRPLRIRRDRDHLNIVVHWRR